METNKKEFCKSLEETLKMTRNGSGIDELEYIKIDYSDASGKNFYDEFVYIHFNDEYVKRVNVTQDGNFAIMQDVMKAIQ